MIDGWQHARPVISIDGTFLKGKYTGKLLVAMGSDSNDQHAGIHVCQNRKGVCIISDRHAGIIEAMKKEESGFTGEWGMHNVDLCRGFCSYGKWSRYHFPCSHIVAGCLTFNLDWKRYIDAYHNLSTLCEMWKYEFNPMSNQAYWTFPLANNWEMYGNLIVDEGQMRKKKKGGKKGQSSRIRTEMDNPRRVIICGRCGQEGHTRRSSRCPQYGL